MHDPRVGRFFATDPLAKEYPWYSPYSFGGNKVIRFVELEGLEEKNPSLFTKAMNLLGSQFHLNRLNAYITKYDIPEENIISLKNDTFVVIRILENHEARFSIFRLAKKNDNFMPIALTSSENDDIDLSLKQFNKTEIEGNLCLPAPGIGGGGKLASGLRIASTGGKLSKIGNVSKVLNEFKSIVLKGGDDLYTRIDDAVEFITDINRKYSSGKELGGKAGKLQSAINSASYYDKITDQGSAIFNSIISGHIFENGVKRTASEFITNFAKVNKLELRLDTKGLQKLSTEMANGTKYSTEELTKLLFKD